MLLASGAIKYLEHGCLLSQTGGSGFLALDWARLDGKDLDHVVLSCYLAHVGLGVDS